MTCYRKLPSTTIKFRRKKQGSRHPSQESPRPFQNVNETSRPFLPTQTYFGLYHKSLFEKLDPTISHVYLL